MADDTVTVEITLPRETYDRLGGDDAAETLAELADDERRMRESVQRYVEREPLPGDPETHAGRIQRFAPPIGVLLDFEAVSVEPGKAVMRMEAGPEYANPMGTLHGGIFCDLGDAAMGYAYASALGEDESFTTLELDVKFLRPVWSGELTATGEVVKDGRTVGLVECDVHDEEGNLVARLQSTCLTLRGDAAAGR
jgi:uncharacterized protein (TIGR00369 family)